MVKADAIALSMRVHGLTVTPNSPSTAYAATNAGVGKSIDSGATWTTVNTGLVNRDVYSVTVDAVNPNLIYAGTWGGGVFKSTNAGASWTAVNTGLTDLNINTSLLYAGTENSGLFLSFDAGKSWVSINNGVASNSIKSLKLDPMDTSILYLGTGNGGIQKGLRGAPVGLATLEYGQASVNKLTVALTVACDDRGGSGCTQYQLSHDGITWMSRVSYVANPTSPLTWTLQAGTDGVRDIYARFFDAVGNSSIVTDSINYDTLAPAVPTFSTISSVAGGGKTLVTLTGTTDLYTKVQVRNYGNLIGLVDSNGSSWQLDTYSGQAKGYQYTATPTDRAGNVSALSPVFTDGLDGMALGSSYSHSLKISGLC